MRKDSEQKRLYRKQKRQDSEQQRRMASSGWRAAEAELTLRGEQVRQYSCRRRRKVRR